MGLGIWSMHYIGMLAYSLPVPVLYDWPTVLLSLLAAILASGVALFIASRNAMRPLRTAMGGVLMGTGIAAMHYIGMEAMRLPAMCHYSPGLVILSVILAIVISLVALWLTFHLREENAPAWLAEAGQRDLDGRGHPGHALHRHGRSHFHPHGFGSRPDSLGGNLRSRHRRRSSSSRSWFSA